MYFYRQYVSRLFDLALAIPGMVLVLPLLALLALLVRWKLGSPVSFRQTRPGRHGRPFELIKFRTMTHARDASGNLLPDAVRLTAFGCWLRSTSLDELPELLNVLKGDMSLVGPRPLLMEYLPLYTPEQFRRHLVRPGITGWAQVNGRNAIAWEQKLALDVWYVDHQSFLLDLKILTLTLWSVLSRRGICAAGDVTMPRFTGTPAPNATTGTTKLPNVTNDRFANWQPPLIEHGKPTKYNWIVQYPEGLSLGRHTDIGAFTYINARDGVTIENQVQVGSHCSIYSVSTIDNKSGRVVLRRNCRIGSHTVVMPGVTVGENSVIGAMSFVNKDIPANVVAFGSPARVVRPLDTRATLSPTPSVGDA